MKFLLIILTLVFFSSCKTEVFDATPETGSPSCDTIDYVKHIEPLFDQHCNSCHSPGGIAPGDFTDLATIQAQRDRIKVRAVIEGTMPPSGPMSDAERELLGVWIDCGAVGEPAGPSYASDIAPIFKAECIACHTSGGTAPGDFNIYDDIKTAVDSRNLEGRVFVIQDMPAGDTISVNDRILLKRWLDAGAPNN